ARMPLFAEILRILFPQPTIAHARMLSQALALLQIGLTGYLAYRLTHAWRIACGAMLTYALYPFFVLYHRLGLGYHLEAVLVLVLALALLRYVERPTTRQAALVGLSLSATLSSELAAVAFIPGVLWLMLTARGRRGWHAFLTLSLAWVLPAALLARAYAGAWGWLYDDLRAFLDRTAVPLSMQIALLVLNFNIPWWREPLWPWLWLGVLTGLSRHAQRFMLLFWGLAWFTLARTVAVWGLGLYYNIPYFPFWAIGFAALLPRAWPYLETTLRHAWTTILPACCHRERILRLAVGLTLGLAVIPISVLVGQTLSILGLPSPTGPYEPLARLPTVEPDDGQAAQHYLNTHTTPTDLIIASPSLAWGLTARATDFQIPLAVRGVATQHWPREIPQERLVHPVDPRQARYVVIDPVWDWGSHAMPAVAQWRAEIEATWPLERRFGAVRIYRNPRTP
ncbi:MAG: hypothetical protein GXO36_05495, partial [Chloroflexi bacterium]|nr:hypothetical protein [Chloroflexota bacterium]